MCLATEYVGRIVRDCCYGRS